MFRSGRAPVATFFLARLQLQRICRAVISEEIDTFSHESGKSISNLSAKIKLSSKAAEETLSEAQRLTPELKRCNRLSQLKDDQTGFKQLVEDTTSIIEPTKTKLKDSVESFRAFPRAPDEMLSNTVFFRRS